VQHARRVALAVLRWCPALPLITLAVLFGAGEYLSGVRWTQPVGDKLSVALLQGNVAQEMKWRPERLLESLQTYYRLAEENPARLTVMPETALPAFLDQIPLTYLAALRELALRRDGDVLFGAVVADGRRYANSALSLGAAGEQRYDKVHLVPFGEFVPPGFAWFMALVDIPLADFTPGARQLHAGRAAAAATAACWPARRRQHLLRGRFWRGDHRRLADGHTVG